MCFLNSQFSDNCTCYNRGATMQVANELWVADSIFASTTKCRKFCCGQVIIKIVTWPPDLSEKCHIGGRTFVITVWPEAYWIPGIIKEVIHPYVIESDRGTLISWILIRPCCWRYSGYFTDTGTAYLSISCSDHIIWNYTNIIHIYMTLATIIMTGRIL